MKLENLKAIRVTSVRYFFDTKETFYFEVLCEGFNKENIEKLPKNGDFLHKNIKIKTNIKPEDVLKEAEKFHKTYLGEEYYLVKRKNKYDEDEVVFSSKYLEKFEKFIEEEPEKKITWIKIN